MKGKKTQETSVMRDLVGTLVVMRPGDVITLPGSGMQVGRRILLASEGRRFRNVGSTFDITLPGYGWQRDVSILDIVEWVKVLA